MFKGEKTLVFWVGLLVFGYSLSQFCFVIWFTIYINVIYPRVSPNYSLVLEAGIPSIISGVIFVIIGLYMIKKGVKQEQPMLAPTST